MHSIVYVCDSIPHTAEEWKKHTKNEWDVASVIDGADYADYVSDTVKKPSEYFYSVEDYDSNNYKITITNDDRKRFAKFKADVLCQYANDVENGRRWTEAQFAHEAILYGTPEEFLFADDRPYVDFFVAGAYYLSDSDFSNSGYSRSENGVQTFYVNRHAYYDYHM